MYSNMSGTSTRTGKSLIAKMTLSFAWNLNLSIFVGSANVPGAITQRYKFFIAKLTFKFSFGQMCV